MGLIDTKFSQYFSETGIMKLTVFLAVLVLVAIAKSEANPAGSGLQTQCSENGGSCSLFGPDCCTGKCLWGYCAPVVKNSCKPNGYFCHPGLFFMCCSDRCACKNGDVNQCICNPRSD